MVVFGSMSQSLFEKVEKDVRALVLANVTKWSASHLRTKDTVTFEIAVSIAIVLAEIVAMIWPTSYDWGCYD